MGEIYRLPMPEPDRYLDEAFIPSAYRGFEAEWPASRVRMEGRALVLTGPAGSGKSVAMARMLTAWCEADREQGEQQPSALWLTAESMAQIGLHERVLMRAKTCALLAIDDLGRTYHRGGSDAGQSFGLHVLGSILGARMDYGLRLVATSNYSGLALRLRLGADAEEQARNWRRIDGDMSGAHVPVLAGVTG